MTQTQNNTVQNADQETHNLRGVRASYAIDNPKTKLHYLVYHRKDPTRGEILVFIDPDLDLDWETDDPASKIIDEHKDRVQLENLRCSIASLEPKAQAWPRQLKTTSKRLLGEAIANILKCDLECAKHSFEIANTFFNSKSKQVSRYWILQGCLASSCILIATALLELFYKEKIVHYFGQTSLRMSLCFCAGGIGALFL